MPDQAMLVALELAALRGVDVTLILPRRSNHRVTFHAGRSYYEALLESGVQLFEYEPGIVHAKAMVVDDAVCLVGSANMDMRSFRFEVHALIHDCATAAALEREFLVDLARSQHVDAARWRRRRWRLRMSEGAARLVSPLV